MSWLFLLLAWLYVTDSTSGPPAHLGSAGFGSQSFGGGDNNNQAGGGLGSRNEDYREQGSSFDSNLNASPNLNPNLNHPQHDHDRDPNRYQAQSQPHETQGAPSSASSAVNTDNQMDKMGNNFVGQQSQGFNEVRTNNRGVDSMDAQLNQIRHTAQSSSDSSNNNNFLFGSDLSQVDKDFIFEGLKNLYRKKILPLEIASKYAHFGSPPLGPSDFEAKPMVVILGQYSVGKTSFIRSLLRKDFPGQRIGPEPTTDRFTAIMAAYERNERQVPGHALVMQQDKPFRGLTGFGNNFLTKFEGAEVHSSILRNITIIDTPGVLAGEKQRIGRDYDFCDVIRWFAERADMIIVMFDAHKLDISDELKNVLDTIRPHQDKIRILLNKADTIDQQQLLRVYGALMWALGKVVQTPEVCKVFLGSFWSAPLKREDNRRLLEREKYDLMNELQSLPANAVVRRINDLIKRARSVKVHAYIIHYLKKQMPYVIGRSEKQKRLVDRLDKEFIACARRYNLPLGDFPNVDQYRKMLSELKDISDFKRLDKNLVYEMDRVMTHDIPMLLQKAAKQRPSETAAPQRQGQFFHGSGL